jgi:hypothetical protein
MTTAYVYMRLKLSETPFLLNILACLCNWILLVGLTILPGTFTSENTAENLEGIVILKAVQYVPLAYIAGACFLASGSGMGFLWWWKDDYKWLSHHLIVGLDVALKGPFPLVGESKLSRESKMSRTSLFCLLKNNTRN